MGIYMSIMRRFRSALDSQPGLIKQASSNQNASGNGPRAVSGRVSRRGEGVLVGGGHAVGCEPGQADGTVSQANVRVSVECRACGRRGGEEARGWSSKLGATKAQPSLGNVDEKNSLHVATWWS